MRSMLENVAFDDKTGLRKRGAMTAEEAARAVGLVSQVRWAAGCGASKVREPMKYAEQSRPPISEVSVERCNFDHTTVTASVSPHLATDRPISISSRSRHVVKVPPLTLASSVIVSSGQKTFAPKPKKTFQKRRKK